MLNHGWSFACAVLLMVPSTALAQQGSTESDGEAAKRRLRELEARDEKTGEPTYLFERVLTLEKMGEYQFALEIIEKHREEFEDDPNIDGLAVVEQRLRREISGGEGDEAAKSGESSDTDVLGWTLSEVGVGALAGGLTSILVAEHRATRLRCSPASGSSGSGGCGGVEPYTDLTRRQFDRKRNGVRTLRVVGIGLGAVGTGLATWGVIRLVNGDTARTADK
ncbi:MAG: hypothetical protein ABEN55_10170 [Bradymonadaceae bacterium]